MSNASLLFPTQTPLTDAAQTAAPLGEALLTPEPTAVPAFAQVVGESLLSASRTATQFITDLPYWASRLMIAGVILLAGLLLIRLGRHIIKHVFSRRSARSHRTQRQTDTMLSLVRSVFDYLMYFLIATSVLGAFGVNVSSLVAVAGVGGVAIGFGAQTLIKDIISGIFLWAEGNVTVGDVIEVNGLSGEVESIALRTTRIRNVNGNLFIVPNGEIRTLTNMSREFKRALIDVPVSYEADFDHVLAILADEMKRAGAEVDGLTEAPEVQGAVAFERYAILVRICALCPIKENWRIERELRRRVKARFDREKIRMPYMSRGV